MQFQIETLLSFQIATAGDSDKHVMFSRLRKHHFTDGVAGGDVDVDLGKLFDDRREEDERVAVGRPGVNVIKLFSFITDGKA